MLGWVAAVIDTEVTVAPESRGDPHDVEIRDRRVPLGLAPIRNGIRGHPTSSLVSDWQRLMLGDASRDIRRSSTVAT